MYFQISMKNNYLGKQTVCVMTLLISNVLGVFRDDDSLQNHLDFSFQGLYTWFGPTETGLILLSDPTRIGRNVEVFT